MVLHNPNNWHWVDKNCIQWSREYFGEKLANVKATDGATEAETTTVRSVEGDVDVCQRKGKVISLFDLSIEVGFKGKTADEAEITGQIKIPEVAYDTEEDEYQFTISIDSPSSAKEPVKALIRSKIVPQLRAKLVKFGPDLIETHGSGLQHAGNSSTSSTGATKLDGASSAKPEEPKIVGHETYNTTSLTLKPVFTASAEQLYHAFVDPELVAAWTRGPPNVDPTVGGKFVLFGGNVVGEFEVLEENKRIIQKWRLQDWKPGHYAKLDFEMLQGSSETTLVVRWTGIPVGEEEVVEANFQNYYVRPIMLTFGYGLP